MGCSSRERRRRRNDWQEPGGGVGVSDRGSRGGVVVVAEVQEVGKREIQSGRSRSLSQ